MELSRRNTGGHFKTVKTKKHGFSRWLTFFMLLAFFVTSFCYALQKTIFSSDRMEQLIVQKGYAQELNSSLNSYLSSLAQRYGIPTILTQNLLTNSQVESDLKTAVANTYAGKTEIFDTAKIQGQVKTNLEKKAQSAGLATDNLIYQTAQSTLLSGLQSSLNQELNTSQVQQGVAQFVSLRRLNQQVLLIAGIVSLVLLLLLLIAERSLFGWLHYFGIAGIFNVIWLLATNLLIKQLPNELDLNQTFSQMKIDVSELFADIIQLLASELWSLLIIWLVAAMIGFGLGFLRRR